MRFNLRSTAARVAFVLVCGYAAWLSAQRNEGAADSAAPHSPIVLGAPIEVEVFIEVTPGFDLARGDSTSRVSVDISQLPDTVRHAKYLRPQDYCPADFNKDDRIDAGDIELFLAVYSAREGPMVDWLDLTADGAIDGADVECFMTAFNSGGCDPMSLTLTRVIAC